MPHNTQQTEKPADERVELIRLIRNQLGEDFDSSDCFYEQELLDRAADLLEAEAQRPALRPLTDEQVTAGARELCRINAGMCGTDFDDEWKTYGEQFKADARACLQAAHGIKEQA